MFAFPYASFSQTERPTSWWAATWTRAQRTRCWWGCTATRQSWSWTETTSWRASRFSMPTAVLLASTAPSTTASATSSCRETRSARRTSGIPCCSGRAQEALGFIRLGGVSTILTLSGQMCDVGFLWQPLPGDYIICYEIGSQWQVRCLQSQFVDLHRFTWMVGKYSNYTSVGDSHM